MSALAVTPAYTALLAKFPPRVIRTEEQNESYIQALQELEQHQPEWTAEEADLADLLTLLIEDFEDKHYALKPATPAEAIEFFAEQHGMSETDLNQMVDGSLAEIRSGKAMLTAEQIKKLSERFHVSPELFF